MAKQLPQNSKIATIAGSDRLGPQGVTVALVKEIMGLPADTPDSHMVNNDRWNQMYGAYLEERDAVAAVLQLDVAASPGLPSLRPADIVASDLGISREEVLQLVDYQGMEANPVVDADAVKLALSLKAGLSPESEASEVEETGALVPDDSVLRQGLAHDSRPRLNAQDYALIDWMFEALHRYFTLSARQVWRAEAKDVVRDGRVIGYSYDSPVVPGYPINLTPQQYSELQLNPAARFPVVSDEILYEFNRRLNGLSTVPHVCVRCKTQLVQGMELKVNLLFQGKLALPRRTRKTKTVLAELGYGAGLTNNVKELQFRHVHLECKVLGPLLDALVRTMLDEGADFNREDWRNDFVRRAEGLVRDALPVLREKYAQVTREQIIRRLADILKNMEAK